MWGPTECTALESERSGGSGRGQSRDAKSAGDEEHAHAAALGRRGRGGGVVARVGALPAGRGRVSSGAVLLTLGVGRYQQTSKGSFSAESKQASKQAKFCK